MNARRALLVLALAALPLRAAADDDLLREAAGADAAVEDRVRLVLVHRLAGDAAALAGDVADLEARDDAQRAAGLAPTGLTDDVRYLAAGLAPTRDAQREALETVLRKHPDPVVRKLAEHQLEADDAAHADRLLADDRHNRRAAVLNDAVRPLGVFTGGVILAALNPFLLAGSAADSVITTAVNLWYYDRLSTPEREALSRYATLLEREPETRDAPEIARAIRRLGTKRAGALCDDTIRLADHALDAHDVDHALFYAHAAERIEGCSDRAARPRDKADEARAKRDAVEDAGRWPVDDPPQPASDLERHDWEDLAVAVARAEPGGMIEAASRFRERHDDSPLAPSALYTVAIARDLAGHPDAARDALADVAHEHGPTGRHAAAILASPEFNRYDAIAEAERRHARETARWVLLGGRLDGRTALHTAAQLGANGLQAAQSFGIFNVIGVATRAWQAWRHDPVSNQAIIDRGEEFLARTPDGPEAVDVHRRLADAYERAGNYERALMHVRAMPEPSEKRIAKLDGKIADRLLADAEKNGGDPVLLAGIVRHFAATGAAEKARQRLKGRPADGETILDRDVLIAYPSLLAPDALDLDPKLLDGDRDNGELADAGVTLAPGQLRLTVYNAGEPGQHVETRSLAPEAYARAHAAAEEALYARALTVDRKDPTAGRFERYIPVYIQGEFGDGGVAVYPGVKMRRYQPETPGLYD